MCSNLAIAPALTKQPLPKVLHGGCTTHGGIFPYFWKSHNPKYGTSGTYAAGSMRQNATITLSRRLKALMSRRGWTIVELAKRSGVSKSAIGNLLNYRDEHDGHPSTRIVEQLAAPFGLQAWEMLRPADAEYSGVSEPEPLDISLLTAALAESVSLYRELKRLPTFDDIAAAAVRLYTEVQTGIPMRRAAAQVTRDLDQIRRGTNLAAPEPPSGEGSKRGQGDSTATRTGKTRTR
jgi:transcriptional regulator with XRE-family HTH domain